MPTTMTRWYWQLFNHLINSIKLNAVKRQQGPSLLPLILTLPPPFCPLTCPFRLQSQNTKPFHSISQSNAWQKYSNADIEQKTFGFKVLSKGLFDVLSIESWSNICCPPCPLALCYFYIIYWLAGKNTCGIFWPQVFIVELTVCINLSVGCRKSWNKLTKKANRLQFQ